MKFVTHVVRGIAAFSLAVFLSYSLFAAEPVAIWDGFDNVESLTQGSYSWSKSAGTTVAEGKVTIGADGGLGMVVPSGDIRTVRKLTLIMDVENVPTGDVTLFTIAVNNAFVSIDSNPVNDADTLHQHWNRGTTDYGGTVAFNRATKHRLAITFDASSQSGSGTRTYLDGVKVMDSSALRSASNELTNLFLGNYNGQATNIAAGMTISRLALFKDCLTPTEVQTYCFPSEVTEFEAEISGEVNWMTLFPSWTNAGNESAVITLEDDATITLPEDFKGNEIIFAGEYTATLVYNGTPVVAQWMTEEDTTLQHFISAEEITAGFTTQIGVTSILARDVESTEGCGTVRVEEGSTLVIRNCSAKLNFGDRTMKGQLVIETGATLVAAGNDVPNYSGSSVVDVYGTLDLGLQRWTFYAANVLNLYTGAKVIAAEEGEINGGASINTYGAGCTIHVMPSESGAGKVGCSAVLGPQGSPVTLEVAEGMTLELNATRASSDTTRQAGLVKTGAGTLDITGDLSTLASLQVSEGAVKISGQAPMITAGGEGTVLVKTGATVKVVAEKAPQVTVETGATILVPVSNETLEAGETITFASIGADAVVTFVDPSGATFEGQVDGNDVTLEPFAYTFTGAGEDANWSNAANWLGGRVALPGVSVKVQSDATIDTDVSIVGVTASEGVVMTIAEGQTLTYTGGQANGLNIAVAGSGTIQVTKFTQVGETLKTALQASTWTGTLRDKNDGAFYDGTVSNTLTTLDTYGNAGSKIELDGCTGYFGKNASNFAVVQPEIVVTGTLNLNNGYSGSHTAFRKVSGTGTIQTSAATQRMYILDGSTFAGAINTTAKPIVFGPFESGDSFANGAIVVKTEATIASGMTWTAQGKIFMKKAGTLYNNGTIASEVTGSGSVVYTGRKPGDATAAKYADAESVWAGRVVLTGTIQDYAFSLSTIANANSTVTLDGFNGYIGVNNNRNTNGTHTLGSLEIGPNGATLTGGFTDSEMVFNARLIGTGTFHLEQTGGTTQRRNNYRFTGDIGAFAGSIVFSDAATWRVVCAPAESTATLPAFAAKQIVLTDTLPLGMTTTAPTILAGASIAAKYFGTTGSYGTITAVDGVTPVLNVSAAPGVALTEREIELTRWTAKPTALTITTDGTIPEKYRAQARSKGAVLTRNGLAIMIF